MFDGHHLLHLDEPSSFTVHQSLLAVKLTPDIFPRRIIRHAASDELAHLVERLGHSLAISVLPSGTEILPGFLQRFPEMTTLARVNPLNKVTHARLDEGDLVSQGKEILVLEGFPVLAKQARRQIFSVPTVTEGWRSEAAQRLAAVVITFLTSGHGIGATGLLCSL